MTELTLDTPLTEEQREYSTMVKSSRESLLGLLNDILDFSKIEAGKLELDPIEFKLRDSVEETMKTLGCRAYEKGLELACRVGWGVPEEVVGDPGRLRQVLMSLVGNAIKFTERGVVVAEVERVGDRDGEIELHFAVQDAGIGITKEKKELIFGAFTQEDSSAARKYGGTGLGLRIARQLVELMGGRIWVDSEVGRGSTFHFTVWLGRAKREKPPRSRLDRSALSGLPVLIVDDNRTNRMILEEMLDNWGMRAEVAENARGAMTAMESAQNQGKPFPLVLLDLHMPGMDGFDLAAWIRQSPALAKATVIMLSSRGARGDGGRCRELGVAAYLLKPVPQSELLNAILTALAKPVKGVGNVELVTRHSLREEQEREESMGTPAHAAESAADKPASAGVFDSAAALERVEGDRTLLAEMAKLLEGESSKRLQQMHTAIAQGDTNGLERAAHALKGALGNLAATAAFTTAQELEAAAREGGLARAESLVAALEKEIERLRPALEQFTAEVRR